MGYTEPNLLALIAALLVMSCVLVLIAMLIKLEIKEYILIILLSAPCSFSWLFIRHSSTYYGVLLLGFICMCR